MKLGNAIFLRHATQIVVYFAFDFSKKRLLRLFFIVELLY